jgi:hypothetical protein
MFIADLEPPVADKLVHLFIPLGRLAMADPLPRLSHSATVPPGPFRGGENGEGL